MKEFMKYVMGTVVGMFIYGIICGVLFILSIIGMAISSTDKVTIEDNSVLVINLSGEIKDHAGSDVLAELGLSSLSNQPASTGLDNLLDAIKAAKANDDVKGIYIEAGAVAADPATLAALRNALKDFRKTGKWIVAYSDQYTQASYYVSSVADKVWLNPQGMLDWHGLASQPYYVKDFLAKFGVKMQVVKVGKYKSATEIFSEDHMSDSNREQVTAYITGIWNNMLKDVSESRKISVDSLNAYADRVMLFENQKELKKLKFVDDFFYQDQVKAEVKKMLKVGDDENIHQVSVSTLYPTYKNTDGEKIAIYYCEGDIVQNAPVGFDGGAAIASAAVCPDLEALAKDDDVKAVVVRINSGGGDAYASEQMWHQIMELKKKKPVVVSMGGMAASGGYYMGCGASWIVAEPTTLTGSIGIFGTFPDVSNLMTDKLGLHFDEVKTNKNAAMSMMPMARPFSADELAMLQKYIDRGYDLFLSRVAEGRKMKKEAVHEIAQGHVWLGKDAIKIKLVDQLGNIDDAVAKAAKLAKLDEYHTEAYPVEPDFMTQLMATQNGGNYLDEQLRMTLGELYSPFVYLRSISQQSAIQARIPFVLNIK